MQKDMHFWGTYVIARAAGMPKNDAHTIAYAAQYVDDSTEQDSGEHEDGGLLYGIATAHHPKQAIENYLHNREEQRRVWVPFHFIPGGKGETLEEKLLCVKDSIIAQEMIDYHIAAAQEKNFGLELIGIAAHVYMDTFSHYGFSGISSEYNEVDGDSFEFLNIQKGSEIEGYLFEKTESFIRKYKAKIASFVAEKGTGALGHAGVVTYPDRPFLHWQVDFEKTRHDRTKTSDRNNPETYMEGCEKLHSRLSAFAKTRYERPAIQSFADIKESVREIIKFQGKKEERIEQWKQAIGRGSIYTPDGPEAKQIAYSEQDWENEKENFHDFDSSDKGIDTHAYRFSSGCCFSSLLCLERPPAQA